MEQIFTPRVNTLEISQSTYSINLILISKLNCTFSSQSLSDFITEKVDLYLLIK